MSDGRWVGDTWYADDYTAPQGSVNTYNGSPIDITADWEARRQEQMRKEQTWLQPESIAQRADFSVQSQIPEAQNQGYASMAAGLTPYETEQRPQEWLQPEAIEQRADFNVHGRVPERPSTEYRSMTDAISPLMAENVDSKYSDAGVPTREEFEFKRDRRGIASFLDEMAANEAATGGMKGRPKLSTNPAWAGLSPTQMEAARLSNEGRQIDALRIGEGAVSSALSNGLKAGGNMLDRRDLLAMSKMKAETALAGFVADKNGKEKESMIARLKAALAGRHGLEKLASEERIAAGKSSSAMALLNAKNRAEMARLLYDKNTPDAKSSLGEERVQAVRDAGQMRLLNAKNQAELLRMMYKRNTPQRVDNSSEERMAASKSIAERLLLSDKNRAAMDQLIYKTTTPKVAPEMTSKDVTDAINEGWMRVNDGRASHGLKLLIEE